MGEVYRATDTKLKRQVAIKVLPPSMGADRDRLARFQREAEVLASLNHPNIAAIYGLEEGEVDDSGTEDGCQMGVRHPSDTGSGLMIAVPCPTGIIAAHHQRERADNDEFNLACDQRAEIGRRRVVPQL